MKALLALAISGWLGLAGGAVVEDEFVSFWSIWFYSGLILAALTVFYFYRRRTV